MKVFILIISLFVCGITQATTYYISPTGNDATGNGSAANPWKTLAKATSTVTTAGDIIHVNAGNYTETTGCSLARGVSIEGDGFATTIIKSSLAGQWSVFLSLDSPQDTNGAQSISGMTFDGQYVSETNNKTWWAISVHGRSNVVIHDMKIINFRDRGVVFDGNDATDPHSDPGHHATGNKFYNNTVLNCAQNNGIYGGGLLNIGGQLGMEIHDNTMIQDQRVNFKNGWPIKYWDEGWLNGVKIYNNILTKAPYQGTYPGDGGDWDFCIELFNPRGVEIYNNTIQGSIDLSYSYKGTYPFSVWIHHNNLTHAVQNTKSEGGIICEFRTESVLIENNVINNKTYGVTFNTRAVNDPGGNSPTNPAPTGGYSYLVDNIIRNNLFSNIYNGSGISNKFAIGVISEGTDDIQINNMQIYNNTIVAQAGNPVGVGFDFSSQGNGNATNMYIRNNIITGFSGPWIQGTNGAGNTNITGMMLTHNDAFGNGNGNAPSWPGGNPANYTYTNNIAANPLFVGSGFYTLQAASPCIDAGVNVGLPFNGAAPDMGYAEYGVAGNLPPTANAGPNQTITLPTSTVTLAGSGTDPDGTVVAYLWTKISGPAAGTITNANSAGTTVTGLAQGVYQFELRVTDNAGAFGRDTMQVTVNAAGNIPPTANAGPNQTITLPVSTVTLAGSGTDPDGTVVAYLWTKISGPAAGIITNATSAGTTVTGLAQGVYQFELRVTDNAGAFGRDTMQVTVNPAAANISPTAVAGPNQTITLPVNSVILSGSGTDPDGTVVAYLWTKISGPAAGTITNPGSAATSVTGLAQGTYQFELRVTDNNGAFGRDTMQVTVNPVGANIPPTANAGPNQTITLPVNSVILSGSGTDPDGNIVAYLWTKISGPAAGTITNPGTAATSVTGLAQGVYQFELRVTDNNGAFGRDTMQVTVNPVGANVPPTANAGPDQSITLPVNTVSLSGTGTDPDGTIVAYLWTKISGPAAGTITNAANAATSVTGLVQGTYRFELRVTDNGGAFGRDTMQVIVNPASTNIPPTANAGPDQTITLPTNAVILSGSGTDPDGTVVAYLWTKVSGPAAGTITNATTPATSVTGLAQGVYKFELRVTDNSGAFGRDTIQVTVNPAAGNIPPTANAGPDQTITLPTNYAILSGSGTDPDGTVVAYLWTKVSGPAAGTITNSGTAATSVTGLAQGVYQFELRVTDNNGAVDRDTMQVTVNPASSNIPPTAFAGPDQTITLPTNATILSGSGTDPDGIIIAYLWAKISGPVAGTVTNPGTAATSVTGLVQGTYRFELRVTDNNGAVGRDTMQVIVNVAPNNPPTAFAGPDQTITLPVNSATLNGTGFDTDGSIVAYTWKQLSGPSNNVLFSLNTPTTYANNLIVGTYEFELMVTDNLGGTDKDTVKVIVNDIAAPLVIYNDARIYPNPVINIATLKINRITVATNPMVVISDVQGKNVFRKELVSTQQNFNDKLDLSNLVKGVYFVTVYFDNDTKKTIKIVKD